MTESSLTATVSLKILKNNLKENYYFHPVHSVYAQSGMPWNGASNIHVLELLLCFFQNWLFIWGRETMNLKGNLNNVLLFLFYFFFKQNENTYWHINIHQREKHTLTTALPCNTRPFRGSSCSKPIFEEIQCLNSFRSCSTEGCEALMAGKIWDIKRMGHCSPSALPEWQEGNILRTNISVWVNLGSMAKSRLTANLTTD